MRSRRDYRIFSGSANDFTQRKSVSWLLMKVFDTHRLKKREDRIDLYFSKPIIAQGGGTLCPAPNFYLPKIFLRDSCYTLHISFDPFSIYSPLFNGDHLLLARLSIQSLALS